MKFDYKQIIDEVFSRNFWPRLLVTIIGSFVLAVNYNLFLLHNDLVIGGTSGIAIILHDAFNIDSATFLMIVNITFLILSFIFLGPRNTGLTIVGSLLYPMFVSLTSGVCDYLATKIVFHEFILIALVSGCLFGTANGFIYKAGFTTGGSDIIIQIIHKYLKIPTGVASFSFNILVILSGAMTFGIEKAVYAVIVIIINSILIDKIMLGISDSKMFYIVTKKPEQVKDFISEMHTGYTIMRTDGGYTNKANDIIMCVISTKQYYMFKNVIEEIDPQAFFIISDCYEVYGGHREVKNPF